MITSQISVEDNAQLESDIVAALCATPRFKPGELPRCATALTDEWIHDRIKPLHALSGLQYEAAIYLGHLAVDPTDPRWKMSYILQRAVEHNPELIVMAARMKKLMAS